MRREWARMAKAEYRRTEKFDATGHVRPGQQAGPASTLPVIRTLPESTTAAELLQEIERLYKALHALPSRDQPNTSHTSRRSAAYAALEAQIRAYSDRYRAFEGWTVVSHTCPGAGYRTSSGG